MILRLAISVLAVVVGLAVALLLTTFLGESPAVVIETLVRGSIGTPTAIGYSLFYATPLIFTGLSVAWALRAGLFNIGAEGQMTMGGVTMVASGILFSDLPAVVALPLALTAAFAVGAFWGSIAGWMKVKRDMHEVLSSILLNFISYGIAGFFILNVFRNVDSQNPETLPIGEGFMIARMDWIGGTAPVNYAFVLALVTAVIAGTLLRKTTFGLRQRWVGGAAEFAKRSGVDVSKERIKAFAISGGLAGLGGASVILGYMHKAREGFAAGAGFIGIAVALLGRGRASGVIAAALLFGALQKGALDLDLDTEKVSRDLATVIQALIIVAVAALPLIEARLDRWRERREAGGS